MKSTVNQLFIVSVSLPVNRRLLVLSCGEIKSSMWVGSPISVLIEGQLHFWQHQRNGV